MISLKFDCHFEKILYKIFVLKQNNLLTFAEFSKGNYFYIDSILWTLAWFKGSDSIRVNLLWNLSLKIMVRVGSYWNSIWIANEKGLINKNRKLKHKTGLCNNISDMYK